MKRIYYIVHVCLLGSLLAVGCAQQERIFNAMGVGVVATDEAEEPTEILITDVGLNDFPCTGEQENENQSKVITVDKEGNILWSFDNEENELNGAHTAEINAAGNRMVISDTCNNRILIISYPDGNIEWDSSLDCALDMNHPVDAMFLDNGNILITDRDYHRVVEVVPDNCNIVWFFGEKGVSRDPLDFDDPMHLYQPHNVERLSNGNTIIADSGRWATYPSRVIEVNYDKQIVWNYKYGFDCTIKGEPNQGCPSLGWARDATVECDSPVCDEGMVIITGVHQTVAVLRNLNEAPPSGESYPRGRTIQYQVEHRGGFAYDSDKIPQWNGDTNGGLGFFLVSNQGLEVFGNWIRVVPVDADNSSYQHVWHLQGWQ